MAANWNQLVMWPGWVYSPSSQPMRSSLTRFSAQSWDSTRRIYKCTTGQWHYYTLRRNSSLHCISSSKQAIQLQNDSSTVTEMKIYSWMGYLFWECIIITRRDPQGISATFCFWHLYEAITNPWSFIGVVGPWPWGCGGSAQIVEVTNKGQNEYGNWNSDPSQGGLNIVLNPKVGKFL